jgi:multiple sugar transport system permease protein
MDETPSSADSSHGASTLTRRRGADRAGGPPAAAGPASSPDVRRRWDFLRHVTNSENRVAYLFLLPWFGGLVFLTAGPLIASLYLSLTNYSLMSSTKWVGFANYATMFAHDPRYIHALTVTLIYVAVSVPAQLAFALLVAVILNRGLRGLTAYRAIYYVPSLLGGSVAVAFVWRVLLGPGGAMSKLLGFMGIHVDGFTSDPRFALYTLVLLAVWQFGSPMVIFLAGLKQVPAELYEAASIDGANRWRQFLRITLPMMTPIIFFNVVLGIIHAFQAFTPAYVVSNGTGGPTDSTLFYTLYLYTEGFTYFKMGYASAMAWTLLLIIAAFTGINFFCSRYWVFYPERADR